MFAQKKRLNRAGEASSEALAALTRAPIYVGHSTIRSKLRFGAQRPALTLVLIVRYN